ncbi:Phosphatase [Oryctes borbonicus]|uniref:acid phosphatase n=1 Tax=Oryctes borbonicus TaxID=1629725 RepID=A0A0T6B4C4_9SCAR|nr:Phosphatase [Oryctes borbonicus]
MYSLGEAIRERYDKFIGDIYTPDILDAWSSSYERCQSSLQVFLAALFPPKGALIWRESLMWQPITYKSLLKDEDNLFVSILMSDYEKLYNEYYLEGNGEALIKEIRPLLSYAQKHYNVTMKTFRDLFMLYAVLSGKHGYGLELPEWSKKIYPQPLSDVVLKEYFIQMGTKELSRRVIGRLIKKILEDTENHIKNKSTYKLHLYSGHDFTVTHIMKFLEITSKTLPDWGACLALELHKETKTYFLEEGKKSMYDLGKIIRRRYNDLLGEIYTPDMLDAWASSFDRCQMSLQVVLTSLFPPKGILVWEEGLDWQPIAYKSLQKKDDNMFMAFILDDFTRMYYEYCTKGAGKAVTERIKPILSYVQEHGKTKMTCLRDLFITHIVWSGEVGYGLELPEWTKKVYPQPLNSLVLEDYHLQMATKEMTRQLVGRLITKILEDSETRVKRKSNYKLTLYSGHDMTIGYLLTFLKIMYTSHAGWAACLAIEVHEENKSHFIEVHYKDDKHAKFELLRFPSGQRRLYLHELRDMVDELYTDVEEVERSKSVASTGQRLAYLQMLITWMGCIYTTISYTKL